MLLATMQAMERIPVAPPIGGFAWTVLFPAAVFVVTALGTWGLYKKFERSEKGR